MQSEEAFFRIIVLADLSGNPEVALPRPKERPLITVTREHIDAVLRTQRPRITVAVPGSTRAWSIGFANIAELDAARLAEKLQGQGANEKEAEATAAAAAKSPMFEAVASAWHGIEWLLRAAEENPAVVVQVWNVSKRELLRDLQRAPEFDQSSLFRRVYSELIDTFGAGAAGCLLADYSLTVHPEDMDLAEKVASVGAAAGAPVLFDTAPQLCSVDRWQDLNPAYDANWLTRSGSGIKFRNLREWEDAEFLFLTLPRFRPQGEGIPAGIWLRSGYLAAAQMAAAFRGDTFGEAGWEMPGPDALQFETAVAEELANSLGEIGLNALRHGDDAASIARMQPLRSGKPGGLAELLADSRLWQRLRMRVRRRGISTAPRRLLSEVRQWLDEAPESQGDRQGRYSIQAAWGRLGLQVRSAESSTGTKPRASARTIVSGLPFGGQPDVVCTVRLLVAADFLCGMLPERAPLASHVRNSIRVDPDTFDAVFEGYLRDFKMHVTVSQPAGDANGEPTELRFMTLEDFAPHDVARSIRPSRDLLKDRQALVDVAAIADARQERWRDLQQAYGRPGGLRALAWTLDGWASAEAEGELSPFSRAVLEKELGSWSGDCLLHWSRFEELLIALRQYQRWARDAKAASKGGREQLCATLADIDRMASGPVRAVVEDETFLQLERTWRGLREVVEDVPAGVEVRTLGMNWYARSTSPAAESWPAQDRLLQSFGEELRPGFQEPDVFTLLVLDYVFDGARPGLRSLGRTLALCEVASLRVICAVTPETAGGVRGDLARAHPLMQRIATARGAEKLILVTGQTKRRDGFPAAGGHPADFVFNKGCAPLAPLFGPAMYRAAAALARAALPAAPVEAEAPLERHGHRMRCAAIRGFLHSYGMDCAPFGEAVLIWNRDEE